MLDAEQLKFAQILDQVTVVELVLATNYSTITPNVYIIKPGKSMDVDDVNFECPAGELPCVVIVTATIGDEDVVTTNIVSLGGAATGGNTVAIMSLRAANALTDRHTAGLVVPVTAGHTVAVTSDTEGDTTIMLTTLTRQAEEYTSEEVDTDHEIDGWPGQTLKRGGTDELGTPQEATVYTNILAATPGKLMFTGPTVPNLDVSRFVLNADQGEDGDLTESFTGAYGDIPGTFTCDDTDDAMCTGVGTMEDDVGGHRYLNVHLDAGWTFESDENVEDAAAQDDDFLYFGYWLQSPANPGAEDPSYMFATYSGSANGNEFTVDPMLLVEKDEDEDLTAEYVGGAAGRYATTKIRVDNQLVDPDSPRTHGRFTATATLNAYFGNVHEDIDEDVRNKIGGTITDFKDGTTDLGFTVDLEMIDIVR